jgi:hypothetical protein
MRVYVHIFASYIDLEYKVCIMENTTADAGLEHITVPVFPGPEPYVRSQFSRSRSRSRKGPVPLFSEPEPEP